MSSIPEKSAMAGNGANSDPVLALWIIFLSCILIPAAIIINLNLGNEPFLSQLADYVANTQSTVATDPNAQP